MDKKEINKRYYLKKLAKQNKEPKYKRDIVLENYNKIKNSMKSVPHLNTEVEYPSKTLDTLEQKIKDLEDKLKERPAVQHGGQVGLIPPQHGEQGGSIPPELSPQQTHYYNLEKKMNELKLIFKSANFNYIDLEKQYVEINDTRNLYHSKRVDMNDKDNLEYLIDIKEKIYNSLLKMKKKFKL